MPTVETLIGICIKSKPYREKDRLATFYTQTAGKIDVVIKNTRTPTSKLAGAAQTLSVSQLQVRFGSKGKESLGTLLQYQPQETIAPLFTQERLLLFAQAGAETLLKLSEGTAEDAPAYFQALRDLLQGLAFQTPNLEAELLWFLGFQAQCLALHGLWADWTLLDAETATPKGNVCFFSPRHHGLLSRKPADDSQCVPISASTQQLLLLLSEGFPLAPAVYQMPRDDSPSLASLQKGFRFLRFYLETFQGLKLQSYALLEPCLQASIL
jgi:DNA repair protein RecO